MPSIKAKMLRQKIRSCHFYPWDEGSVTRFGEFRNYCKKINSLAIL